MATSAFVYNQLRQHRYFPVVRPFSPYEIQYNQKRSDSNDSAGRGADTCILDGLCKGIKPMKARLDGHSSSRLHSCAE